MFLLLDSRKHHPAKIFYLFAVTVQAESDTNEKGWWVIVSDRAGYVVIYYQPNPSPLWSHNIPFNFTVAQENLLLSCVSCRPLFPAHLCQDRVSLAGLFFNWLINQHSRVGHTSGLSYWLFLLARPPESTTWSQPQDGSHKGGASCIIGHNSPLCSHQLHTVELYKQSRKEQVQIHTPGRLQSLDSNSKAYW